MLHDYLQVKLKHMKQWLSELSIEDGDIPMPVTTIMEDPTWRESPHVTFLPLCATRSFQLTRELGYQSYRFSIRILT